MVVKSLQLGKYKSLNINPETIDLDPEVVDEQMKLMIHDKAADMGLRQEDPDGFLAIDDGAVLSLGIDNVKTVQDLEGFLRRKLFQDLLINKVMKEVLDDVTIEYNEAGVDKELEILMEDVTRQASELGFTLEFYCDYHGLENVDALRVLYKEEILTSHLEISTVKAIAKEENIVIRQEQLLTSVAAYESLNGNKPDDLDSFKNSLLIQETVNWLVANNVLDVVGHEYVHI